MHIPRRTFTQAAALSGVGDVVVARDVLARVVNAVLKITLRAHLWLDRSLHGWVQVGASLCSQSQSGSRVVGFALGVALPEGGLGRGRGGRGRVRHEDNSKGLQEQRVSHHIIYPFCFQE